VVLGNAQLWFYRRIKKTNLVSWSKIARVAAVRLMAVEDAVFMTTGIARFTCRACWRTCRAGGMFRVESTLPQQLVKNFFSDPPSNLLRQGKRLDVVLLDC